VSDDFESVGVEGTMAKGSMTTDMGGASVSPMQAQLNGLRDVVALSTPNVAYYILLLLPETINFLFVLSHAGKG
jgi:hypothetical protein